MYYVSVIPVFVYLFLVIFKFSDGGNCFTPISDVEVSKNMQAVKKYLPDREYITRKLQNNDEH